MKTTTTISSDYFDPKKSFEEERIVRINKIFFIINVIIAALIILILALATLFASYSFIEINTLYITQSIVLFFHLVLIIYSLVTKFKKTWLKHINMVAVLCDLFATSILFISYNLFCLVPLFLSLCYSDLKLSIRIGVVSLIVMISADCLSYYYVLGTVDLDTIVFTKNFVIETGRIYTRADIIPYINNLGTLFNYMKYFMVIKMFFFTLVASVFLVLVNLTSKLIKSKDDSAIREAAIQSELNLASDIQQGMLPKNFDVINQDQRFVISACSYPAKEVGGDFYDMFKISENKLAFLIADVSGKGVPAALFMTRSKTLIKSQLLADSSLKDAIRKVNKMLLEENEQNLFVTLWLGVLDLQTGCLNYVNAGHTHPVLLNEQNGCQYLKNDPQLFICAYDDTVYKQEEIYLKEGDILFLYTDGVTEAVDNNGELFGSKRLLSLFKRTDTSNLNSCLNNVKYEIDNFSKNSEQFDDITMLIVKYRGKKHEA